MPECLDRPRAIFEGLRRDSDDADGDSDGWLCYSFVPDRAYNGDGSVRRPYEGEVFLAFVNKERIVYNWGWEQADPMDAALPEEYEDRFQRRVM